MDRIAWLTFANGKSLIAELIGPHSDVLLVDDSGEIRNSFRSIRRGAYVPPGGEYRFVPSKVAKKVAAALEMDPADLAQPPFFPTTHPEFGVYVGRPQEDAASLGMLLDAEYRERIGTWRLAAAKDSLLGQLTRVYEARQSALASIDDAIRAGGRAGQWQRMAELLLAYGPFTAARTVQHGTELEVLDYEGQPISIPIDTDGDWKSTAERLFARAKSAKGGANHAQERRAHISAQIEEIEEVLIQLELATRLREVTEISDQATRRRWLFVPSTDTQGRAVAAFDGHKIRQVEAPDGTMILIGENATSNDYLTLKVAHPADLWLHIRGGPGSHVVVRTNRQPQRIRPETVRYAAWLAARHSSQKHSDFVTVSIVEKRYVRKPRHSPPGTMQYDRERTLTVNPTVPFQNSEKA
jgi:predicted ribosome quality control (RQC) complex YloA/Tae2 family protein